MATITEKLKWLIEADATSAVKGFKSAGDAAEKELDKATKSSQKLGDQLTKGGAGAMAFSAVVGTALIKAAGSFENLALESGKMSDATGLSVEQSSRWIEVAGDMGIGADTIEGALGKMNKTLGATPEKFAALGIEVARTNTGVTDVNGTFLNTIARLNEIKDPAERAAAAAQIFGKGWQESAELLKLSTNDIKTQLASVSDQKVINDEELIKAKEYRASLDTLKDSVENLALSVGQSAAPVIGGFATVLAHGVDAFSNINEASGGAAGTFLTFGTAAIGVAGSLSFVAGQITKMQGRFHELDGSLTGTGKAAIGAAKGLALIGTTIAGLEIANALTRDTGAATGAMNKFINEAGHIVDVKSNTKDLLDKWQEMSETVDKSKGIFDRTLGDIGHAFDQSGENLAHLQAGFDKLMATSPQLAAETVAAMEATATAAAAGDEAAQHWLDKNSLSTNVIAEFRAKVDDAAGAQEVLTGKVENATTAVDAGAVSIDGYSNALKEAHGKAHDASQAAADHAATVEDMARRVAGALGDVERKWDEMTGAINDDESLLNLQGDFDDVKTKAVEAFDATKHHAEDAEGKVRDAHLATDKLKLSVIDFGKEVLGLPPSKVTEILAQIDAGDLAGAEAALNQLTRDRVTNIRLVGHGIVPHATGGFVGFGEGAQLVGEKGPELVKLPTGSRVSTARDTAAMLASGGVRGAGMTINVHMTVMGTVKTERDLARSVTDAIIDAQRRGEIPSGWAAA